MNARHGQCMIFGAARANWSVMRRSLNSMIPLLPNIRHVKADCICLGQGGDQIANLTITHVNIQKFVNIPMHDPIGLFHGLLAIGEF
jgi:hypothetical protein